MPYRTLTPRLVLVIALVLVAAPGRTEAPPAMDALVTAEWLAANLSDPDLVVLDCSVKIVFEDGKLRGLSGREDYEAGHIPGAAFADLTSDLSDTESPHKYAEPTPEQFCAVMGGLGVGDETRVVLYDNSNAVWASRVWWMLRWVGFDRAAVLDGGLGAWTAEEQPLSSDPITPSARKLTPAPRPELIADLAEVRAAMADDGVTLMDAMPEAHYLGQMVLYDRPGHIPGAVNVPVTDLLDEMGRFRSQEELPELFGSDIGDRFIVYCGGGIAASANALIMTRLGFGDVAVYTASLQEWAADPDNPLTVAEP